MMCALTPASQLGPQTAPPSSATSQAESQQALKSRDRQHDFDFHIGTWKTHLKRRLRPLTGSNTWTEYEGTTVVRKVWDGRANLVELKAAGPAGHFEGIESATLQSDGSSVESQFRQYQ
jgi:hypothetical protein